MAMGNLVHLCTAPRIGKPAPKSGSPAATVSLAQARKTYTNLSTATSEYVQQYEDLYKICKHFLGERRKGIMYPAESALQGATDFRNQATTIAVRFARLDQKERSDKFQEIRAYAAPLVTLLEKGMFSEKIYTLNMEKVCFVPIEQKLDYLGDLVYALLPE